MINNAWSRVEVIKNEIEKLRRENVLQGLAGRIKAPLNHPKEEPLRGELIELKDLKSKLTESRI